jgi:hypothetical protein
MVSLGALLGQVSCAKLRIGPAVDGFFVPETPNLLLSHGRFDHSINIMAGHNGDEGVGYPLLPDDEAFECTSHPPHKIT